MIFFKHKLITNFGICLIVGIVTAILFFNIQAMQNNYNDTIRIEAENYQNYYDLTSGNRGQTYRNDDVDIWQMSKGGFRVGAIQSGEWLNYDLDVPEDGTYKIVSRVGSKNKQDREISISLDEKQLTTLNFDSATNKFWQNIASEEIELKKGNHQLRLDMLSSGFALDYFELVPVSINQDVVAESTGNGLRGEYYNNKNFSDLKLTRTDSTLDFNWDYDSPDSSISEDTFSARWTGQIEPLFSETYNLYATTDDGVRLWVDDRLIIDKFIDRGTTQYTGTIDLLAGQKYDIRMEYYENLGRANASLAWSSDSQSFEIVPQSQLYSESIGGNDDDSSSGGDDSNIDRKTTENILFSTNNIISYENFNDNSLENFKYERPREDSIRSSYSYDRDNSGQSLEVNLLKEDKDVHGSRRSEIRLDHKISEFDIGDEAWIGFSVLAPENYQHDNSFEIIFQMHSYPDSHLGEDWKSPALNLSISNGNFKIIHQYDTKAVTTNNTPEGWIEHNLGAVETGVWTDFTLHFDYQLDDNGLIELYQNGQLAYSYQGEVGYNDIGGMFAKFGIYKPDWKYNPERSSTTERTLYFDAFRLAHGEADLEDVDPATIYKNQATGIEPSPMIMGRNHSLDETLSFNLDTVPKGESRLNLQAYGLDDSNELSIYVNDKLIPLNETSGENESFQTSMTFDSSFLNVGENTIELMANPDDSYFIVEQLNVMGFE